VSSIDIGGLVSPQKPHRQGVDGDALGCGNDDTPTIVAFSRAT
jgi:hypothetical protein